MKNKSSILADIELYRNFAAQFASPQDLAQWMSANLKECAIIESKKEGKKSRCYLMKLQNTNLYKIGMSDNPYSRVNQIQTGCPLRVELNAYTVAKPIGVIESLERQLHGLYSKKRKNGEWFELNGKDIANLWCNFFDIKCCNGEYINVNKIVYGNLDKNVRFTSSKDKIIKSMILDDHQQFLISKNTEKEIIDLELAHLYSQLAA